MRYVPATIANGAMIYPTVFAVLQFEFDRYPGTLETVAVVGLLAAEVVVVVPGADVVGVVAVGAGAVAAGAGAGAGAEDDDPPPY